MDILSLVALLREHGVLLANGLTDEEVARVERTFGFVFPPDLRALLQQALPISPDFPNWRDGSEASLRERLAWPAGSAGFDVEHNDFWIGEWGPRPENLDTAIGIAKREIAKAPTLIPIYSHRFIPEEPHLAGNPVFSVWQLTDTIYYGANLANYFENEFPRHSRHGRPQFYVPAYERIRKIRFWSPLVAANY